MKDAADREIYAGDRIGYISGYGTPYIQYAEVLEVEHKRIKARPLGSGFKTKVVWLCAPRRVIVGK
jgi:hypothetical protein